MKKSATKKVPAQQSPHAPKARGRVEFPVVGIGASAGGLDAFKQFFNAMPADSGMAFVLIQHLDPTHESLMVDLLSRYTPVKVMQVEDRMPVQPDCAFMIPPNKSLAISDGVLQLTDPVLRRGMRMPIDFFFAPWPKASVKKPSASCFRAPAPMAPWDCRRSRPMAA